LKKNSVLQVPKQFVLDFFKNIYFSILPDCNLWDKQASILIEPIVTFNINNMIIKNWKLVNEWIEVSFNEEEIITHIEGAIDNQDTDLDQFLTPISKNYFSICLAPPREIGG